MLSIKEALSLDESGRIDAGYFSKAQQRLRSLAAKWKPLGDFCSAVVCGPFGSTILDINYLDEGIPMIRPFNLRELRTDAGDVVNLSQTFVSKQSLKVFRRGDLVFARVGDVGCSVIVQSSATISPNIIAASIKRGALSAFFCAVFFNTEFGFLQIQGAMKVVAQPTISTDLVRKLRIPIFSDSFQQKIESAFLQSEDLLRAAGIAKTQAEQTLLRALGLEGWEPPEPLTYTRHASEVIAAGRVDSDYFAPARYATIQKLAAMPHRLISDCCDPISELLDPTDQKGTTEVRNFDVTDALNSALENSKNVTSVGELGSTKKIMQPGDVVISRLRSYLRQIAVVRTDSTVPTVGSTEFIVLRPRQSINPELLMVFLRSQPVQTILKYCQEGNQHPRFGENNLLEIPFPELLFERSDAIVSQIRHAHTARQEAQRLLALAKRAVEMAIEEGEAHAMKFLDQAKG